MIKSIEFVNKHKRRLLKLGEPEIKQHKGEGTRRRYGVEWNQGIPISAHQHFVVRLWFGKTENLPADLIQEFLEIPDRL